MPDDVSFAFAVKAINEASSTIKQVESELKQLESTLQKAGQTGHTATGGFNALHSSIQQTHSGLSSLISTGAGLAVGFAAVNGAISAFSGLGKSIFDAGFGFAALKEQSQIAFTTMLGDAGKAKDFLADLQQFANKTPFEMPGLLHSTQLLMAMGFEAKDVIPALTAISGAVASMGGGAEQINRVTVALGQMNAKGKTSSEEMMQLTEAGINAWQLLANHIGKSVPEAMDLVSKGAVSSSTTINAVLQGVGQNAGKMLEAQSQSFNGLLSTLKDTFRGVAADIMDPLFQKVKEKLGDIVNFISSPEFTQIGKAISSTIGDALEAILPLIENVFGTLKDVGPDAFVAVMDGVTSFADAVVTAVDGITYAMSTLASVFAQVLSAVLDVVVTIGTAIYEALSYLNPFAEHSPSLVNQVKDGTAVISDAYTQLGNEVPGALSNVRLTVADTVEQFNRLQAGTDKLDAKGLKDFATDAQNSIEQVSNSVSALKGIIDDAQRSFNELSRANIAEEAPYTQKLKELERQQKEIELAIAKLEASGPLTTEVTNGTTTKKVLTAAGQEVENLKAQLAALSNQAKITRLEDDLNIGPLKDQIKDLANTTPTLKFQDIIDGMKKAQDVITTTTPEYQAQSAVLAQLKNDYKDLTGAIKGATDAEAEAKKAAGGGAGGTLAGGFKFDEKLDLSSIPSILDKNVGSESPIAKMGADFKNVSDSFKNMKASLGELGSTLRPFVEDIIKLFTFLKDHKEILAMIALGLVAFKVALVAIGIAQFVAAIITATQVVGVFGAAVAVAGGPFTLIALAIAGLVVGVILLIKYWDEITAKFPVLQTIVDAAKEAFSAFAEWLMSTGVPAIQNFTSAMTEKIRVVVDWVKTNWPTIKEPVMTTLEAIKTFIQASLDAIKVIFDVWFKVTFELVKAGWALVQAETKLVWDASKTLIETTLGVIKGVVDVFMGVFTGDWQRAWDGVKTIIDSLWKGIKEAFNEGATFLQNIVPTMVAAGKSIGGAILDGILTGLKALPGLAQSIGNQLWTALKWVINQAIDMMNDWIPDEIVMPGQIPNIDLPDNPIPRLAIGARNFKGGLALVGEKGPELVALPKGSDIYTNRESAEMLGEAGSKTAVTINVSGPIYANTESDANKFFGDMGFAVTTRLRAMGSI